jgi:hypothetical protein
MQVAPSLHPLIIPPGTPSDQLFYATTKDHFRLVILTFRFDAVILVHYLGGDFFMEITFLYYEECPSHDAALERLQQVLTEEDIDEDINIIKVETEEQAQQLRFVGSPTILVNGKDIVPPAANAHYNLTCRAYILENGRVSPLPSPDMIRRSLRNAVESIRSANS